MPHLTADRRHRIGFTLNDRAGAADAATRL